MDLMASEYIALTTFRHDGRPVTTPVWAAEHDGALVVYTPSKSGKVRRIRHTPDVEFAASDFSGQPLGPLAAGRAAVLPTAQAMGPRKALARKYGWRFHWFRLVLLLSRARRRGGAPVIVALRPNSSPSASTTAVPR